MLSARPCCAGAAVLAPSALMRAGVRSFGSRGEIFQGSELGSRDAVGGQRDVQQRLQRHKAARLADAAMRNEIRAVRELLEMHANPNSCDEAGRLPLYAAAFAGSVEVVQELLSARADANIQEKDREGGMPLQVAAFQGHVRVAKMLLRSSASANNPDRSGWTPLCSAASQGHTSVVRVLLESRAEPLRAAQVANRRHVTLTPLQAAMEGRHVRAAEAIREALPDAAGDPRPPKKRPYAGAGSSRILAWLSWCCPLC